MKYSLPSATRNQLGNASNPHQGKAIKALCVCSAGLLRSPTIAKYLTGLGYNTRACGTSQEYALIPVTQALLSWADEIHVVSSEAHVIEALLKGLNLTTPVVSLPIADEYGTFDPALEAIITEFYITLYKKED